ncbi:MAG: GLUG motif-containing protein, partial [Bacteroidales bacterium]|nr:GLUG motif-containing protein [Bacteroidales bacterium]
MKKHLLYLVALCLFSWASFAQTVATAPSGNGTEGTPYQIQTLANLLWISENPEHWDKYYLQTADIDAAETASWNEGEGWVPIGIDLNNDFTGTYNGGDFTISNLTINRPTGNYQGLFGSAENATIKNIRLVNVNIVGASSTGAIVGQTQDSYVEKCLSTGTVTGTTYVGGLIGFNNYGDINQCHSSVNVTGTNYI